MNWGNILFNSLAAVAGTAAFALLFGVPRKYYISCSLIGGIGWFVYSLFDGFGLTAAEGTFLATLVVVIISRFAAVHERCPLIVFMTTGIFPLIPGGGIYWTAYYLVTGANREAALSGIAAVKAVFALVLGIIIVLELPGSFFRIGMKKW